MNKQEVTLYLSELDSIPLKGSKVIYKEAVSRIYSVNDEDNIFLTEMASMYNQSVGLSELQHIQCYYHELGSSITRIVPLSRDDYEYAINHIGKNVWVELIDVMGMTNWNAGTSIARIIPKSEGWDEAFNNCDVKITREFEKTYLAIKKEFKKNYHPPIKK
jgi:hypothetical protein